MGGGGAEDEWVKANGWRGEEEGGGGVTVRLRCRKLAKPFYQQQIFGQLRKDISGQLFSSWRSQAKGSCADSKYLAKTQNGHL